MLRREWKRENERERKGERETREEKEKDGAENSPVPKREMSKEDERV